jgi:hypothetical protein
VAVLGSVGVSHGVEDGAVRYMPDRIMRLWPWVTRRRYETVKQENYTLRDALREANSEVPPLSVPTPPAIEASP